MGTIGHNTLLHNLNNWQIRAAIRGYYRQQRTAWETSRFIAYVSACSFGGKIKSPQDLIKFPWEIDEAQQELSEEKIQETLDLIREENERMQREREEKSKKEQPS